LSFQPFDLGVSRRRNGEEVSTAKKNPFSIYSIGICQALPEAKEPKYGEDYDHGPNEPNDVIHMLFLLHAMRRCKCDGRMDNFQHSLSLHAVARRHY
jgi:hypothetical protein